MKHNKTLTNIRINSEVYNQMMKALEKMNKDSDIEFSLTAFRRLAYKFFATHVLTSKGVKFVVKV